jgi:hypothetical protein
MFNIGSFLAKAMQQAQATAAAIEMGISLAHTVEAALPIPGAGKQKLDYVLNSVQAALTTTEGIATSIDIPKVISAVSGAVSSFVFVANAIGAFKKPATPAA